MRNNNKQRLTTELSDATELYLLGTKLTIQDFILRAPYRYESDTGVLRLKRLQDLDTTLTLVERWIATWFRDPVPNFRGATVVSRSQILSLHALHPIS